MFLSALLSDEGTPPTRVATHATVTMGEGPTITRIELVTEAEVPGVDEATFQELATAGQGPVPGLQSAGSGRGDRPERDAALGRTASALQRRAP